MQLSAHLSIIATFSPPFSTLSTCLYFLSPHANSNMYYWNRINWYKMNLSPPNWNMLYWKWHEYSMNLSLFHFYEYSWLCVCVCGFNGNRGLPRETTHRAGPHPLIPLFSLSSLLSSVTNPPLISTLSCSMLYFDSSFNHLLYWNYTFLWFVCCFTSFDLISSQINPTVKKKCGFISSNDKSQVWKMVCIYYIFCSVLLL